MVQAIFAILMTFAAWHGDAETRDERATRMMTTAEAMYSSALEATCTGPWVATDFCKPVWNGPVVQLVVLQMVTGKFESAFAEHVGVGRCRPWECDRQRARHYWQVWKGPMVPKDLWLEMRGTEYYPTTRAAYAAASVLGQGRDRCKSIEGTIAFYARSRCRWEGTVARLDAYHRVKVRFERELQKENGSVAFYRPVN